MCTALNVTTDYTKTSEEEQQVFKLIHELHVILNRLKGFEAGYTSQNQSSMLVKQDGLIYKVSIEQVGEGEIEDHFDELREVNWRAIGKMKVSKSDLDLERLVLMRSISVTQQKLGGNYDGKTKTIKKNV